MICPECKGKGYNTAPVYANARYYSPSPAALKVICWRCQGERTIPDKEETTTTPKPRGTAKWEDS